MLTAAAIQYDPSVRRLLKVENQDHYLLNIVVLDNLIPSIDDDLGRTIDWEEVWTQWKVRWT